MAQGRFKRSVQSGYMCYFPGSKCFLLQKRLGGSWVFETHLFVFQGTTLAQLWGLSLRPEPE